VGAVVLIAISYGISFALHKSAVVQLNAAKAHLARADWLDAIHSLDSALRRDRYVSEARLLRATAINQYIFFNGKKPWTRSRDDALADLDLYLREQPNSGDAHFQRGIALAGLAKVDEARTAFAHAITLLPDPTEAYVERAALSFHTGDYATAVSEMSAAIKRHPLVADYYDTRALYRQFIPDQRGKRYDDLKAARLREPSKPTTVAELDALERDDTAYQQISEPQDSPAVVAERGRFRKTWKVVIRESNGDAIDTTDRDFSFTFEGDRYKLVLDGRTVQNLPFALDPSRRPRQIDWIATIRNDKITVLGIYEFRGDTLVICMGNAGEARPSKLSTEGAGTAVLYTLRPSGQ
jgi:uncharacterized protein (TIGR03067 family)